MNKPILTVAIPTYNRPQPLRRILESLKLEDPGVFNILISDDSSNEGVELVVKEFQTLMPNLYFNKNISNLGFNGNVSILYELADTRYVWFLCDDDLVYPNAVRDIIFCLKK